MFVSGEQSMFTDGVEIFSNCRAFVFNISMDDARSLKAFCSSIDSSFLENCYFNDVFPYGTSIIKLKDKWVSFDTDIKGNIYNVHVGSKFDNVCMALMKKMYPNTNEFRDVLNKYWSNLNGEENTVKDRCYCFKVKSKPLRK